MNNREQTEWLRGLLTQAQSLEPQITTRTGELVQIESPSSDKAAIDRAVSAVAAWCADLNAGIKIQKHKDSGNTLQATFKPKRSSAKPLMLLGHLDTFDGPFRAGRCEQVPGLGE